MSLFKREKKDYYYKANYPAADQYGQPECAHEEIDAQDHEKYEGSA